jgi:hypothetical protein
MFRHVAVAALVVLAAACSDDATSPSAPGPALQQPPSAVRYDTARGVIAAPVPDEAIALTVVLVRAEGDSVRLVGPLADVLGTMPGVEFWVQGRRDDSGALDVVDYAYRGTNLDKDCPKSTDKCRTGETGIRPRARATWKR